MNRFRWLVGAALLLLAISFGIFGFYESYSQWQLADNESLFDVNEDYADECGDCHIAYPPGLLPAESWTELMAGLEDHFGDNAELDTEMNSKILQYLKHGGLQRGQAGSMSKMLRNFPEQTPLRITELPFFTIAHREISSVDNEAGDGKSFGNCEECHRGAELGRFRDPVDGLR